jgi:signal transduction histidine kinase
MREANQQMETFLGMASHELKTPLTSISMGLQLIQRRLERLEPTLPETVGDIHPQVEAVQALAETTLQQGGRLNRLVNDLLDTSRIQVGRLTLQMRIVDLALVVRMAVDEQRQAVPGRTILLHLPTRGGVSVYADPERIGQVITNYLTNALKYSDEESVVEVGIQVEQEQGCVWVRDQGPGIPLDEQEHLWERFHRVPGIEVRSGTGVGLGLGLYISKTIIESHQGQVGVESLPGQGAMFWFTLPLMNSAQEHASLC